MTLSFLVFLVAVVLAETTYSLGTLYISRTDGVISKTPLVISKKQLIVGDAAQKFWYGSDGTLNLVDETESYIDVNDEGKLVETNLPHSGFYLNFGSEHPFKKELAYFGATNFQLCGNGSIGHKSICQGARKIQITFEVTFLDA
ncbi:hypothetical protein OXX79_001869 [Metschnikowia pulcherrima]